MSGGHCDRCSRRIWEPVKTGFMLYCFGHLDNTEGIFVSPERKKSYRVKACDMFLEREETQIADDKPEILQRHNSGKIRAQSFMEGFFG